MCVDFYRILMEFLYILFYFIGGCWFGGILGLIICKLFLVNLFILVIFMVWIFLIIGVDWFYVVI